MVICPGCNTRVEQVHLPLYGEAEFRIDEAGALTIVPGSIEAVQPAEGAGIYTCTCGKKFGIAVRWSSKGLTIGNARSGRTGGME